MTRRMRSRRKYRKKRITRRKRVRGGSTRNIKSYAFNSMLGGPPVSGYEVTYDNNTSFLRELVNDVDERLALINPIGNAHKITTINETKINNGVVV